jgi:tetratricopeptide (TPR) repeat protein
MNGTVLILLGTVAVFGASLGASFHFDDYTLFSDPTVTSPSGWWSVWQLWRTRPLTYFTFWLNYQLGGQSAVGYHAVNLALHLLAVWILNGILVDLVGRRAALIATAVFALHPIQTEPVAYVWARAILLATVFCLISLRAWLDGRYLAAAVWFSLALISKEECVTFPLFLFLIHRRAILPAAGMLCLSAAATGRVFLALKHLHVVGAGAAAGISPINYFATQGTVVLRYLRLLLLPYGFTFDPDIPVVGDLRGWIAWVIILGIAVLLWRFYRHGLWFAAALVLLAPSSTIFPAADLAADRRLYLPMVAFATLIGLLLAELGRVRMVIILVILALATISVFRTQVWLTERALWAEAVERSPKKVRPRLLLARASDTETALRLLTVAEELAPGDPKPFIEKGARLMEVDLPDLALAEFDRAMLLTPKDPMVLNNRGAALAKLGRREDAIAAFSAALFIDPCWASARANLQSAGITYPTPCSLAHGSGLAPNRPIY